MFPLRSALVPFATVALLALAGCSGQAGEPETLVIHGAAGVPAAEPARAPQSANAEYGDPVSLRLTMYSLYLGATADCSDLVLAADNGPSGVEIDLMAGPQLFAASPPNGTYPCLAFRMADVVVMSPATTFGDCSHTSDYALDLYREGACTWIDATGRTLFGHGSDAKPVDDRVTVFLTTDPAAAMATGIDKNQIIQLGAPLTVPSQPTFYWGAAGTVVSDQGACRVDPGQPTFN